MSEREPLRTPIDGALQPAVDERDVARMWRHIQTQSAARERGRRVPSWALGGASFAALALIAALLFLAWPDAVAPQAEGALRAAGGDPLPSSLSTDDHGAQTLEFSDGSRIELSESTAADVLDNGGDTFRTLLRRGRARFEVHPGGPRRWSVETGALTIEVVGTAFVVDRSAASVRVDVEHGVVLVRGEHVPERAQRLTAGQHIEVALPASVPAEAAAIPQDTISTEAATDLAHSAEPLEAARPEPERRLPEGVERGGDGETGARPGADGLDALFAQADAARAAGRSSEAIAALERALAAAPSDPRAAVAAFTLGVLELEVGQAARAAAHFERAASHPAGSALREDAMARAVEAWQRAGDPARARSAASAYEARYPGGRRLREVRGVAEPR